jgi:hypothetical protein
MADSTLIKNLNDSQLDNLMTLLEPIDKDIK